MTPRLKDLYYKDIQPALKTQFGFKNLYLDFLIILTCSSNIFIWILVDGYLVSLNLWYIIETIPFSLE